MRATSEPKPSSTSTVSSPKITAARRGTGGFARWLVPAPSRFIGASNIPSGYKAKSEQGRTPSAEPRTLNRKPRHHSETSDAFPPPLPVLSAPPGCWAAGTAPTDATLAAKIGAHQTQMAELADRVLRSLRVGRVGKNGYMVRMRLSLADGDELDVTLEERNGHIEAIFDVEPRQRAQAQRIAATLDRFMGARGMALESSVVST